jgi:hypothetical protein
MMKLGQYSLDVETSQIASIDCISNATNDGHQPMSENATVKSNNPLDF